MKKLCRRMSLLLVILFVALLGVNGYVKKVGQEQILKPDDDYEAQAALVLGAYVTPNGYLCDMLRDRVETAVELYQAGKVKKLLMSGDHGQEAYDEVKSHETLCRTAGCAGRRYFYGSCRF